MVGASASRCSRTSPGGQLEQPSDVNSSTITGIAGGGTVETDRGIKARSTITNSGRNRTGQLFCMMAQSLVRSKDIALGGFYRRLAARRGGLIATKALARKLAGWFWRVMVKGDDYVEQGLARYEEQVRKSKERTLKRLAKELGRELVSLSTVDGATA